MGKRINVLRASITFDIEVDPSSTESVNAAVAQVNEVRAWARKYAADGCTLRTTTNFLRTTTDENQAAQGSLTAPGLEIPPTPNGKAAAE